MFFSFLCWIVIGVVLGFIANKVVPLNRSDDPKIGLAIGAAGAGIGGFVFGLFSHDGVYTFQGWSLVFAIIGGIVALAGWHTVRSFLARA